MRKFVYLIVSVLVSAKTGCSGCGTESTFTSQNYNGEMLLKLSDDESVTYNLKTGNYYSFTESEHYRLQIEVVNKKLVAQFIGIKDDE